MSMILMRTDLDADPRVVRMAEECGCGPVAIIGGLWWIWARAQTQSTAGVIRHMTAKMIDHGTGIPGLADAAEQVGWLIVTPEGVAIPDFETYFGQSSRERAQARLRKSRQRGKPNDQTVTNVTPAVTNVTAPRDESSPKRANCATTERNGSERIGTDLNETELSEDCGTPAAKPARAPAMPGDGCWGEQRWGIRFDPKARQWINLLPYDRAQWEVTCPAVDLDRELAKAANWCVSDPRGRKANYRKFLNEWMNRSQQNGGSKPNGNRPSPTDHRAEKAAREHPEDHSALLAKIPRL